ncbi:Type I phosphodiesterase / nucleotide pyrophosphatase [Pseudobythopirellula maris]|uniref:Type I phosphodiesterase / nucleotide pyrophosphatase n=1 Tax=Pseudobythopirellula maris TaxID=2527991 RepID=A0A5C5ZJ63_9BACT|nr:nucleotide pyrophosphatase/phosphodiesterase family protein [Pseudobythopirellula maris]TWT87389.1 Type I phosphodiesterase / nucleotide pyrophosphatase [Pseudobythopirellula maris]
MREHVVLLSIPALREQDLAHMPQLSSLMGDGDRAPMAASLPAVTCPVQVNMTTGLPPAGHGITSNGLWDRERRELEMWTAWNDKVEAPQIWDRMHEFDPSLTAAAWFPLYAKGCGADYVCWPAPKHEPDGSESLWCYTKPEGMYQELLDELGHFPLQHFWGPMANIKSTEWIVTSAIRCAERFKPNFFYVYLQHLDYASQKLGPDSPEAIAALGELDAEIGRLADGFRAAYGDDQHILWLAASEYVVTPVDHVVYPNRVLREAGLTTITLDDDGKERLDLKASQAWALADHQHAHVYVRDRDAATIQKVVELFKNREGVAEVLGADEQAKHEIAHDRTGDVVLVSEPNSWMAYYYWLDDEKAPAFARQVDIHRKTGYDPVEMHVDMAAMKAGLGPIPLDASLVCGSHGAPPREERQRGVMLSSERGVFVERTLADVDVCEMVLRQFGV